MCVHAGTHTHTHACQKLPERFLGEERMCSHWLPHQVPAQGVASGGQAVRVQTVSWQARKTGLLSWVSILLACLSAAAKAPSLLGPSVVEREGMCAKGVRFEDIYNLICIYL